MPKAPKHVRLSANVAPDVDLWLVKLPNDFDLKQIDGQSIVLPTTGSDDTQPIELTTKSKVELALVPSDDAAMHGIVNAFPSSTSTWSTLGKPFTRMYTLQSRSSLSTPQIHYKQEWLHNRHVVAPYADLKQRFKPVGSRPPLIAVTSNASPTTTPLTVESDDVKSSKSVKKEKPERKRKRDTSSDDVNVNDGSAMTDARSADDNDNEHDINVDDTDEKKKKKKKKHRKIEQTN